MGGYTKTFNLYFLIVGVVVTLVLTFLGINQIGNQKQVVKNNLQVEVFTSGSGYGYRILSEDNILIQQNFIPALAYNQPFCNREEAEMIALYVLQKLQKGSNPATSFSKLKELGISFNCVE
ncbi:DUF4907 domain-containing protein [Salegentibacter sp. F14]